jgi:hypothetical protein
MTDTCIYDVPWQGECGNEAVSNEPPICDKHADKECWCGEQAVKGCSVASSLVCGQPLCETHKCHRTGSGMTGTTHHSKEGREQYMEWKEENK